MGKPGKRPPALHFDGARLAIGIKAIPARMRTWDTTGKRTVCSHLAKKRSAVRLGSPCFLGSATEPKDKEIKS